MMDKAELRDEDEWRCLLSFLPDNWEQMAADGKALLRLRGFSSVGNLLRVLLIHLIDGISLRQTVVVANHLGFADVSDVSLLKRLNASGEWFRQMACGLMKTAIEEEALKVLPIGYDIQLVDATCISKPGSKGTDWRVHYSIALPSLQCRELLVTDKSVGESLRNFVTGPQQVFIGDRGYSHKPGIAHVVKGGGHVIIRMNSQTLPLIRRKKKFELLSHLKRLGTGIVRDWEVEFDHDGQTIRGRVCAIKKSRIATEEARQSIIQSACKKQSYPNPDTLIFAGYIFVFTTLDSQIISATKVLELYRGRWQIELAFKRLKSLLELGTLPKKDPPGAKAWIYGKIFAALLIETLVRNAESFSPWGYRISDTTQVA
jgi:hypothetical protein